ncbi:hypothetical protein Tco_0002297 [Tanacetum coccineum]
MRTRSQARISVPEPPVRQPSVESSNLEKPDNPPIVTMADNRTMAQLLEAPTEGYEDAIVIPEITANNFEIKHGLLNLVQNKQFFGNDKEDPHAHIHNEDSERVRAIGAALGIKSIWNSTWRTGGRPENFGMILGQPVHTDDNVETTEFNWHEIDFESVWLLAQMAHLVANITFASTRSGVMEITSLAQRELVIVVAIVGVTVVVVAAGVVVVLLELRKFPKMQEIWINKAVYQHPEINNTLAKCDFRRNVPESTYLVFELSIPNLSTFKALSWALIVGLSSAFRTVPCYRWSPPLFAQYYICQYRGLPGLMEITISCSRREDSPSYLLFLVSIVGVGVAVVVVAAGVVVVVGVAVVLRGKIYGYKAFISSIVK